MQREKPHQAPSKDFIVHALYYIVNLGVVNLINETKEN